MKVMADPMRYEWAHRHSAKKVKIDDERSWPSIPFYRYNRYNRK